MININKTIRLTHNNSSLHAFTLVNGCLAAHGEFNNKRDKRYEEREQRRKMEG